MRGPGTALRRSGIAVAAGAVALGLSACGGEERQDADERAGTYPVEIVETSFPRRQRLAQQSTFEIAVRNAGDRTIPNIAVTLDGFASRSEQAGLADPEQPVWIVDALPEGGNTAYVNTVALGALRPRTQRTFRWRVTAIVPGTHELKYRVSAGLDGKAKARLRGGGIPEDAMTVRVLDEPARPRVDPSSGEVIREGPGDSSRETEVPDPGVDVVGE